VNRKKSLEDYRKNAPEIPTNTCPYIDFVQEILKEVIDETDSLLLEEKLNLAESMLEYIRHSNDALRQSSHYWYNKFKTKVK
jgi:hypothetical protein